MPLNAKYQDSQEKIEKLLTLKELSKILKIKESTLANMVQYREIPYVKLDGQHIRFRISEIREWALRLQNKLPKVKMK